MHLSHKEHDSVITSKSLSYNCGKTVKIAMVEKQTGSEPWIWKGWKTCNMSLLSVPNTSLAVLLFFKVPLLLYGFLSPLVMDNSTCC